MKSVPLAELVELQIGYRPVSNQIQPVVLTLLFLSRL